MMWTGTKYAANVLFKKCDFFVLWTCQHTDLSVRFLCMNNEKGYVVSLSTFSWKWFRWCISYWHPWLDQDWHWIDIQVLYHTDENASSLDTLALIYETTCITHHNKQSTYGNLKLKYCCFVFLSRNWFKSAVVQDEGSYCFCKVQMVSQTCLNTSIR